MQKNLDLLSIWIAHKIANMRVRPDGQPWWAVEPSMKARVFVIP
jgi:hypothetical protein